MIVGNDKRIDHKRERKGLFIKAKRRVLDQTDILYIESMAKKVEIHVAGAQESIEIYATMKDLEEQLGEDFYRCHRTYLVNMAYISRYGKDYIRLTNGDKIYISKKRYGAFVKSYQNYLQNSKVSSV